MFGDLKAMPLVASTFWMSLALISRVKPDGLTPELLSYRSRASIPSMPAPLKASCPSEEGGCDVRGVSPRLEVES